MACDSPTEVEVIERLGMIVDWEFGPEIEIAVDDRDISITVVTYGNGCTARGPTEVSTDKMEIDIIPLDTVSLFGPCPDIFQAFDHVVSIHAPSPGTYTAAIRGVELPSGDTITVSREITVR